MLISACLAHDAMIVTKSKEEMIQIGRQILGFEHCRSDCNVVQSDGIDVDSLIGAAIRQWYLQLLDTGEERHLATQPLTVTATQSSGNAGGTVLSLPDGCRRVLTVRLGGWHHAVRPAGVEAFERICGRQLNKYSAAVVDHPNAVMTADGKVVAWPDGNEYGNTEVYGVVDEGEDSYTFDDSALDTLGTALQTIKIPDYGSA